jgi:DNA-binding IclR family transcriptional regulator
MPLHANAGGKLVYAYGEPAVRQSIDDGPLEKFTEHTIVDPETLKAEVERVRQQGWANAPEEFVIGINAVAAPIFDRENRLVATMALVNSIQFLGRRSTGEQISAITAAAAEVTRHLALRR